MNEFQFTKGSLEAQGLQEGDEVECTYSSSHYFTVGYMYTVLSNGYFKLYVEDDDGHAAYNKGGGAVVKFKPVSVNVQQYPQGQKLQDILHHCKEGDVLECVRVHDTLVEFDLGYTYDVVIGSAGYCVILDGDGLERTHTGSFLFIKLGSVTTNSEDVDQHDSWGVGNLYTAPKKEWQPDVLDVDLTKKIAEW